MVLLAVDQVDALAAILGGSVVLAVAALLWKGQAQRNDKEIEPHVHDAPVLDSALPLLGILLDHFKHGHRFHDWVNDSCLKLHGQPWKLKIPGQADVIMVCTPELLEDITKTQFDKFIKGDYQRDWMHDFLGGGILTSDGERWVHQRKAAAKFFSTRVLRDFLTQIIQKKAGDVYAVLEDAAKTKSTIDLQKLFKNFAVQAFAEMGFGIRINGIGT